MVALAHELFATASVAGRICVGLVFVAAATHKAQHGRIFSGVVANYRLLPRALALPVAALLPPVELMLGLLLLSAQFRPFAEFAAIGLLALFAAAMAINIRRGRTQIDCGCGQSFLKQTLSWTLVWRNAGLTALLLPSLAEVGSATMSMLLTGVAAGLALFLLYLALNIFAALPGMRRFA